MNTEFVNDNDTKDTDQAQCRLKLIAWNFDPDNVSKGGTEWYGSTGHRSGHNLTTMAAALDGGTSEIVVSEESSIRSHSSLSTFLLQQQERNQHVERSERSGRSNNRRTTTSYYYFRGRNDGIGYAINRTGPTVPMFSLMAVVIPYGQRYSRPMILFTQLHDISMMDYIYKHSDHPNGELSKTDQFGLFPLYVAIPFRGTTIDNMGDSAGKFFNQQSTLFVCRWLLSRGANVQQTLHDEWTPFSKACLAGMPEVAWLLLANGAFLSTVQSTPTSPTLTTVPTMEFDSTIARRDMPAPLRYCDPEDIIVSDRVHRQIFERANAMVNDRRNFMTFLLTASARPCLTPKDCRKQMRCILCRQYQSDHAARLVVDNMSDCQVIEFVTLTSSPVVLLHGQTGIMENIAKFVGVERSNQVLVTAHGLIEHQKWWEDQQNCHGCSPNSSASSFYDPETAVQVVSNIRDLSNSLRWV